MSFGDAVVFAGLIGLKAWLFYETNKPELQKITSEDKQDFLEQPAAVKEIAGSVAVQIGSLVLENQRKQLEQRLEIRQKFLNSIERITTAKHELELLVDYEMLQGETMREAFKKPQERMGLSKEGRAKFKSTMDPRERAKQRAKKKVGGFISNLIGLSGRT